MEIFTIEKKSKDFFEECFGELKSVSMKLSLIELEDVNQLSSIWIIFKYVMFFLPIN